MLNSGRYAFMVKRNGEKKACHAGRRAPKEEKWEGHCVNRKPHTCRGGNQRNSIPGGSPTPSCSQVGNNGVYSCRKRSRIPYIYRSAFSLLSSAAYRSTVAGKSQMFRVDQPLTDGKVQELLLIKTEDEGKGLSGLNCQRSSKGRRLEAMLEESQGVLSPFFSP